VQSLEREFSKIDHNECLVLATLLDPRYKGYMFTAAETLDKANKWIGEVTASAQPEVTVTQEEGQGQTSHPKQPRREAEEPTGVVD